ncbi:MAG TPA: hypothetical protein VK601_10980 [Kofleriaceae bacterium]|nr:hypothetical protein [Kofleriaceae bacterium]
MPPLPRSPRQGASRHVILFVAADPRNTTWLALASECAAIARELRASLGRDDFEFRSSWAASAAELMHQLAACQPTIVHVCGRGGARWPDAAELAVARLIASAAPSIRVVVLDSCFSDAVAEVLRDLVDCVVGMTGDGDAARAFTVGFYRALGNRRSIRYAIAQTVARVAARRIADHPLPVCRTRDGVSADQIFLGAPGR